MIPEQGLVTFLVSFISEKIIILKLLL